MNSHLFAASCGRASGRLLKQLSVSIFNCQHQRLRPHTCQDPGGQCYFAVLAL
jgi:hypothetical protein